MLFISKMKMKGRRTLKRQLYYSYDLKIFYDLIAKIYDHVAQSPVIAAHYRRFEHVPSFPV